MDKDFKIVSSMRIKGGGQARVSYTLPEELKHIGLSCENMDLTIQYYLLARYSFLHRMQSAFMINSFWAVEHAILSILVLTYKTKDELLEKFEPHKITKYWAEAKNLKGIDGMEDFDDYIGVVQGYFAERYPEKNVLKLTHSAEKVQMFNHSDGSDKKEKELIKNFSKTYKLDIDALDKFINFFLTDITNYGFGNLGAKLASFDSIALYKEQNQHSIIMF